MRKKFYFEGDGMQEQVAQRDIQKSTSQCPGQPALAHSALRGWTRLEDIQRCLPASTSVIASFVFL